MDLIQEIRAADARLGGHIRRTPAERSLLWSEGGGEVFLKLENMQITGSFKVRGATNKILSLKPDKQQRGVVAASSGNHGVAVAHAISRGESAGCIFVPEGASQAKVETMRRYGVEVHQEGDDCVIAEALARQYAKQESRVYISPYNDLQVIAGQGTIGVELARQLDHLDAVFIALGGGGLISGIGTFLKSIHPKTEIVACSPQKSSVMHASLEAGKILDLPSEPTLSDGTAGGVEEGSITFELCQGVIDRSLLVSEEEIRRAMELIVGQHHQLIEGAAGVAVAGYLQDRERYRGKKVAIILCGANISLDTLRQVL